jgi:NAD(P)H-hydrate epimerase
VVLAGPGNNGGDGYVAARYLKMRGVDVEVQALAPPKTPEAIDAASKARAVGVRVVQLKPREQPDVIVDALFGGGVRGGLPDVVTAWMDSVAPVVAVDYPTGLNPDTGAVENSAFHAVETVTFSTLKTGHVYGQGPDYCGRVTVVDIGIDGGEPSMFVTEQIDAQRPVRRRSAHKWSAGTVLVIGGSTGIVGASVFAGSSALNFGAGSVVVASPRADLVHEITPQLPSFDFEEAEARLDRFDVVICGPGLAGGDSEGVTPILEKAQKVILDAGGLTPKLLEAAKSGNGDVLITPHAEEFRRVAGIGGGAYSTRAFASHHGITVLLKGNPTLITDGCPPILVDTGGPELASIGTGDVLAGMIGALWARGLDAKSAAVSGAYWHGVAAGDLSESRSVTATTLCDYISAYAW